MLRPGMETTRGAVRKILGAGLLAATFTLSAAEKAEPVRFYANARVVLDEQGIPQQVQANEKLPPAIRDLVEQRVMQWRFEPARVNGEARAGVTHVLLQGCGVPDPAGDGMRIAMDYFSNGPGLARGPGMATPPVVLPPPRYPTEAARRNREGSFEVAFQVGVDGRATVEKIEAKTGSVDAFKRALHNWIAEMRFVPEEVAGAPIATRMVVPVDFHLGGDIKRLVHEQREKVRRSPECMAAGAGADDPSRPVVLDSPFKPLTTG